MERPVTREDARLAIPLEELPDRAVSAHALPGGRKVVVVRSGSDVRVFGDMCPHMGAELSEATFCPRAGTLRCKWHGYLFDARDGRFLENPNERTFQAFRAPTPHFRPEKAPRYRLPTVPHVLEGGVLVIGRDQGRSS
jgi:nitrite reductase/ring-hydroxylating ferredoxin subunit